MTDMDKHIEKLVNNLQSPKSNTRYEACEHLRVAPAITPEAIRALQTAVYDQDESVAEAAKRALAVQLAPEPGDNDPSQPIPPSEDEFDIGIASQFGGLLAFLPLVLGFNLGIASLLSGLLAILFLVLNFVFIFSPINWISVSCVLIPAGIVLGILGLLQKNRTKIPAIIGLVISIGISLMFLLALSFGQ